MALYKSVYKLQINAPLVFALLGYGPLQTINMSELYGVVMLHGWCPERTCARDHLCG